MTRRINIQRRPSAPFPEVLEKAARNRGGQPEEVAEVAAFLASDRASFVTGAGSGMGRASVKVGVRK